METSVIILPFGRPFYPSYTAGILIDILRKNKASSKVIDANLLFYNYIYGNTINIFIEDKTVQIESKDIEKAVDSLKMGLRNEKLSKQTLQEAHLQIMMRNRLLNRYFENVRFSFFDVKLTKKVYSISDIVACSKSDQIFRNIFKECIPILNDDIYFISIMSPEQLYFARIFAEVYKSYNKDSKVVVGGAFFNNYSIDELSGLLKWFDCISLGDAELVFPEILHSYAKYKIFYSDKGIISRVDSQVAYSEKVTSSINDVIKYSFNRKDFDEFKYYYPIYRIPVLISRECCYGKCIFCTNNSISNHVCRIKKVAQTLDELSDLKVRKNEMVEFIDDNVHAIYLRQLSQGILSRGLNIAWIANSRFYSQYLSIDICQLLHEAGCRKLFMGLESYNQETLDSMNKGIQAEEVIPILQNLKNVGIHTHISIMFGFPGETLEQARCTQNFLCNNISLIDLVDVNCFVNHEKRNIGELLYNAEQITIETRNMIKSFNKEPSYYNTYKNMIDQY